MTSLEASHAAPVQPIAPPIETADERAAEADVAIEIEANPERPAAPSQGSPDPMFATDRYRLVTPYKLHV